MNNDEYLKKLRIELSKSINQKIKIYLDTKYWVDFCDMKRGINTNDEIKKIYLSLKERVKNNQIICPISMSIFIEILKQSDKDSLLQTAEIIDELSQGSIILNEQSRIYIEAFTFFYDKLGIEISNEDRESIWDISIANMYGSVEFEDTRLSEEENIIVNRLYLDKIRKYTLVEFIELYGIENLHVYRDRKSDINYFNENKQRYIFQNKTFHQLYMSEIGGVIEAYKEIIKEVFIKVLKHKADLENNIFEDSEYNESSHLSFNIIYNVFKHKKMGLYLASLDVGAMLHSKLRWNRTQKYKQGDFNDIAHATTALPYYDYFFTEKSLHNMIRECKYDEKYNCIVASKNNNILEILEKLDLR